MRKSRYSDSQILAILKQNEQGVPVSDLCREHGMSSAQFYKWRAPEGSGGRECPAEEDVRRGEVEGRDSPGGP
jgi:transposase-like protein